MRGLAGILLAAGASRRLGTPKQLLVVDGELRVRAAAAAMAACCDAGVVVVTGAGHDAVLAALAGSGARAVYNPGWQAGMGGSLAQGARAAAPGAAGLLVWVCDQVDVGAAELRSLAAAFAADPAHPAAAWYDGGPGVPAIFPAAWRDRLAALSGDAGARSLLAGAAGRSDVPMPGAAADIDTPEALAGLRRAGRLSPGEAGV